MWFDIAVFALFYALGIVSGIIGVVLWVMNSVFKRHSKRGKKKRV